MPKSEGGYRTTCYEFPDGDVSEPVAFFGWVLQQRIRPDRLVVLGTSGSMWDHLFESDLAFGQHREAERLALLEAVDKKQVESSHLAPLAPLLAECLGCEVCLDLIPYCRDAAEQVGLLRILAGHVRRGECVHLDVTHGFRHLPMLALLAAFYLRLVQGANIAGIWYGAYDPDTGKAQVHELSGLLHLADWLQGLATYDKDGDYGVFAPLLGEAGEMLRQASFFERTTHPVRARQCLTAWKPLASGQDPACDLFQEELSRRIAWYRHPTRPQWEQALAWRYLHRGDYLRAAIYGLEARISRHVQETGGKINEFSARKAAQEWLRQHEPGFNTLSNLRNAMAHSVLATDKKIQKMLEREVNLASALKSLLNQLLEK